MANDIVFKTKAFGGFNKAEVMDYINNLIAEKVALENRINECNAEKDKIYSDYIECKKTVEEFDSLKTENERIKQENSELSSLISAKDSITDSLKSELNDKEIAVIQLEEKIKELSVPDEMQAELDFLRAEVTRLKSDNEKKKDLERQVGAAMLDARVHSEELVEEAKEKANAVTKSVYSAIGETALRIDDLSGGISEIARSFTKSVEEVELRIKALTGDMSKTAQLLIAESGAITDNVSATQSEKDKKGEYDFTLGASQATEVNFGDYTENE